MGNLICFDQRNGGTAEPSTQTGRSTDVAKDGISPRPPREPGPIGLARLWAPARADARNIGWMWLTNSPGRVELERKGIVLCKQLRQNCPHRELQGEALAGEHCRLAAYI